MRALFRRRRLALVALFTAVFVAGGTTLALAEANLLEQDLQPDDYLWVRCEGDSLQEFELSDTETVVACGPLTDLSPVPEPQPAPQPEPTPEPEPGPATHRPDATTTGFRVPESELRLIEGSVRASQLGVAAGGTISKVHITGELCLDRPNVRVVDSWIEDGVAATWKCGVGLDGAGAIIEHNELGPREGVSPGTGIGDSYYTARYNEIRRFEDGARTNAAVVFEHNWVHSLIELRGSHNDAVQLTDNGNGIDQGGPTVIRFNRLENQHGQTGAVTLGADTGLVRWPVTVQGNWISGGGYTLYGGYSPDPARDPVDVRIIDNVWETTFFPKAGYWGPVVYMPREGHYTWSGNRWADGRPLTPRG